MILLSSIKSIESMALHLISTLFIYLQLLQLIQMFLYIEYGSCYICINCLYHLSEIYHIYCRDKKLLLSLLDKKDIAHIYEKAMMPKYDGLLIDNLPIADGYECCICHHFIASQQLINKHHKDFHYNQIAIIIIPHRL